MIAEPHTVAKVVFHTKSLTVVDFTAEDQASNLPVSLLRWNLSSVVFFVVIVRPYLLCSPVIIVDTAVRRTACEVLCAYCPFFFFCLERCEVASVECSSLFGPLAFVPLCSPAPFCIYV